MNRRNAVFLSTAAISLTVGGVSTHDPHKIFGDVKVNVTHDKYLMYITFNVTPKSPMDTSDMIVRALDYNLSFGDVTILDAIKISYVPAAYG